MVCGLFSLFRTNKWTHMHHFSLASISLKGTSPPPETMHLKTLFYWKLRRTQYFVSTQTELRTATQTEPGPFPHALVYKYGHYEASFPKHFISITLFLQAHIVMFIYLFVCLLLVYFMEAALLCSFLPFFAGNP